jgi:hypothetical protein
MQMSLVVLAGIQQLKPRYWQKRYCPVDLSIKQKEIKMKEKPTPPKKEDRKTRKPKQKGKNSIDGLLKVFKPGPNSRPSLRPEWPKEMPKDMDKMTEEQVKQFLKPFVRYHTNCDRAYVRLLAALRKQGPITPTK